MITAKNYVAQAIKSLQETSVTMLDQFKRDRQTLLGVSEELSHAVRFALPDGGVIFDDELRGIKGGSVRLPFQTITIEYFAKDKPSEYNEDLRSAQKRLIYCFEAPASALGTIATRCPNAEHFIVVFSFYANEKGVWVPCIMGVAIPSCWDETNGKELAKPLVPCRDEVRMAGIPIPFMRDMIESGIESIGLEKLTQYAAHDISGECRAVLELCEALSCTNVTHEPIEKINPAVNARRVRDGKLPMYETRCLVINAGIKPSSGKNHGGTHASPRQHLRRGHIRRLHTGNVWVNSCVVGSKDDGVIEKSYKVAA